MTRHPLTLLGPLAILRALGKLEVARPELVSVDHVPPDEPESEPPHAPLRTGRASPAAPALAMLAVVLSAVAAHPIPAAGAEMVGRSAAPEVAGGAPEGLPPEVWEAMLRRIRADRSALRGRPHVADGTDGTPALTEDAKLTASDAAQNDDFGASVAVSGITVVVGAPFDDDNGDASGSAYVFVRPVGGWTGALTEDAKLTASDGAADHGFGFSVAISGDTVVAGALGDDSFSGSAYVFVRPVGGWAGSLTENAKLTASDGAANDLFSTSTAISGNVVVAGAAFGSSAYLFVEPVGGWAGSLTEDAELTASDGDPADQLGFSIAIWGNTVVAGAPSDDVNPGDAAGSAYVFSVQPPEIFDDGFESGDTSAWSQTVL